MEIILLLLGLLILGFNYFDFFHTTLSGQGFGKLSGTLNKIVGHSILKSKRRILYKYSGFSHLMITVLFWLLMLMLGTFTVYSSAPDMVLNADTKFPATLLERFYFTCSVISTLGIGDFIPGNNLSRIITSFLSFSGFILLTTALTYLLSVVGAVLQKKQLALYISTLGNDIEELYNTVTTPKENNTIIENSDSIRKMIIKNSSNYIFFPIVQYFLSDQKKISLELQLTRLYEVLIVLNTQTEKNYMEAVKIKNILAAIATYLELGISDRENYSYDPNNLQQIRETWSTYKIDYLKNPEKDTAMNALLMSAGWTWEDVYASNSENVDSFKSKVE